MELFNQLAHYIGAFMDYPAVQYAIAGLTTVYGIVRILANTNIGKKYLNKLKDRVEVAENNLNSHSDDLEKAKEELLVAEIKMQAILDTKNEEINAITDDYETKVVYLDNKINSILDALSNINNDKVKNIVEQVKASDKAPVLSEALEEVKQQYESKYQELLNRLEVIENGKEAENDNTVEE